MCVVSMIGDHYDDKWKDWAERYKQVTIGTTFTPAVTQDEFNQLKKEVEDMKALLKRAKIYDEQNNEPNCEIEEKMKFLREIAKFVGIDLDEVFKPKT